MNTRRLTLSITVLALLVGAIVVGAQDKPKNLPRTTTEATINGKKVSISYGRPSINGPALAGQDLFAAAPVGTIWRLGRNEATVIESTGKLDVDGKVLEPGKYSLWARRLNDDKWVISFHPKTEDNGKPLWGAVAGGKTPVTDGWVADLPLTSAKAGDNSEFLDIKLSESKGKAWVTVHFGNVTQSGSFGVK